MAPAADASEPVTRAAWPRHLFTAPMADSEVGLSLPARQSPCESSPGRVTLEAAAALYRAERWLPALEDWLGSGLVPALTEVTEPLAEASMFDRHVLMSNSEFDAEVHLPLSVLAALGTPPSAALAAWRLKPVACTLVVDALPLSADDLGGLEVGALLVLPASFAGAWQAWLQPTSAHGGAFGAQLAESHGRLRAVALGDAGSCPARDLFPVRVTQVLQVPIAGLLGWSEVKPHLLDIPALTADGGVTVFGPGASPLPLASGQLIPIGEGFALRIGVLPDAATQPPRRRGVPG